MSHPEKRSDGRYAYQGLSRIFHERSRLGILSSLAGHAEGLLFNDLKRLVSLTDGNLSRQIQILEQEGLVEVWKGHRNNRPMTLCRLTENGRNRFVAYIAELERVVKDASAADTTARAAHPSARTALG